MRKQIITILDGIHNKLIVALNGIVATLKKVHSYVIYLETVNI